MSNEAKILTGISVVTLGIVIGAAVMFGGKSTAEKPTPPVDQKLLVHEDSHKKGADKSKVTIVEFGDFQCPACGAAHPVVAQVLKEYGDKVTFVFRNFPLNVHKNAELAAQAAEAAGAQNKFFEMHDKLYENQEKWSEKDKALDIFVEYAKELKLDVDRFKKEVEEKKYKAKIEKDISDGNAAGVNSTPTFYINGVAQAGVMPFDEFKKRIEEELGSSK